MSPHATMQVFMAQMQYPPGSIEDRASAFAWLLENFKPEEWPAYLDVPAHGRGTLRKTNPLFGRWCFVDPMGDGKQIIFANFIVPSISYEEFVTTINMQPEIQHDRQQD